MNGSEELDHVCFGSGLAEFVVAGSIHRSCSTFCCANSMRLVVLPQDEKERRGQQRLEKAGDSPSLNTPTIGSHAERFWCHL
jgi:hypothetical protein